MNIEELRTILVNKSVNESLYSLGCLAPQSESYSIVKESGLWKVVYKERGEFSVIASNLTENDACTLVYGMFRDMFCWDQRD
ncbi:MAG TPA: hypothetical protein VFN13_12670 [Rudaea sp.]|nr:hypothetical protein [Rudaea sp.]